MTERRSELLTRDFHIHTPYCNHASGSMEEYVLGAIDKNMTEIGFLAHLEAVENTVRRTWLKDGDFDVYWEEGKRLANRYQSKIKVSLGLEVGLNPAAPEVLEKTITSRPWDRIGLSFHHLPEGDGFVNICSQYSADWFADRDHPALTRKYYRTLREFIPRFKPDMICHFDVITKYMGADCCEHPEVWPEIDGALKEIARIKAMLEINTSGYPFVKRPYPSPPILRKALEYNIPLTLSSDSHAPDQIGRRFQDALEYIENVSSS